MFEIIKVWFWNRHFWLPSHLTWADLVPSEKVKYPDHRDLIFSIPLCAGILVLRYFLEKYCFSLIGQLLAIRYKNRRPIQHEPELERLFRLNGKPGQKEIEKGAAILSKSEREIARWFRIRQLNEKPSRLRKFCENSFRFTYYLFSFCLGLIVLWNKEWLWDIHACWNSFPFQSVDRGVWWHTIINISFICSLTISHFFDVKHKDFWPMFVHHIATIMLLFIAWICNMIRMGSLVLVVHDFADIILELSKMALYAKYHKLCDCLFIMFILSWIITRLGIFPVLIYITIFNAKHTYPAARVSHTLLILLLILHIYWTYLIFKLIRKTIVQRKLDSDIRSSSDDEGNIDDSVSLQEQENDIQKEKKL